MTTATAASAVNRGRIARVFREPSGRPRKGWRLTCYLALVMAATGTASIVAHGSRVANLLAHLVIAAAAVGLAYVFRRHVDRREWSSIGLSRWSGRDVLTGFATGAVSLTAVFALSWALGWIQVTGTELSERSPAAVLGGLATGLIMYAASAVMQETAFRGYALQTLADGWPMRRAAMVSGLLFVLPHFSGPPSSPLLVVVLSADLMLMAGFFVLTRLATGGLWLAIGFHTSWNWAMDTVLSMDTEVGADYGHALVHVAGQAQSFGLGSGGAVEWLYLVNSAILCCAYWLITRRRRRGGGGGR
nr:type II CAAX endopeptidase family protein [Microbispora cellulosiformans]